MCDWKVFLPGPSGHNSIIKVKSLLHDDDLVNQEPAKAEIARMFQ